MEGIAGISERVGELQRAVETPTSQGFAQLLTSQLGQPTVAQGATAPVLASAAAPAVTLGQMLGLPPASFTPGAPVAAVAQQGVGAVGPGGLMMPVEGRYTSRFGMRTHPISGNHKLHAGVDLAAPTGTPYRAAMAGTVTYAGPRGGYGNLVIVEAPDGTETRYAHSSRLDVSVGDRVERGQTLGAVGSTGASTGPHLHFEVRRNGEAVDPAPLLGLGHEH